MNASAKRGCTNADDGDEAKVKVKAKRGMLARVPVQGKRHVVAQEEAAEAVAKAGTRYDVLKGDAVLCPELTKEHIRTVFPDLSNIRLNPEVFVKGRLLPAFKAKSSNFSSVDLFVHGTADASVKSIFKTSLHTGSSGACYFTRDVSTAASYAERHAGTRRRVVVFAVALQAHETHERIVSTPAGARHLPLASALLPQRHMPSWSW